MTNEERIPIDEEWLDQASYLTEIDGDDGLSYKKVYHSDDLEWEQLGGERISWKEPYRFSSKVLSEKVDRVIFWDGKHKSVKHKYVTGDRLDLLEGEAQMLKESAIREFDTASSPEGLLKAKLLLARSQGMYHMLSLIRGFQG